MSSAHVENTCPCNGQNMTKRLDRLQCLSKLESIFGLHANGDVMSRDASPTWFLILASDFPVFHLVLVIGGYTISIPFCQSFVTNWSGGSTVWSCIKVNTFWIITNDVTNEYWIFPWNALILTVNILFQGLCAWRLLVCTVSVTSSRKK